MAVGDSLIEATELDWTGVSRVYGSQPTGLVLAESVELVLAV